MVFTFFSLIIFFGVLFIFGWQLARFILSEKRIEALIPIAAILGFVIYLFSLNSLSYLVNIQINFYLLLAIFAFLSYFLYRVNGKKAAPKEKLEWGISRKWRIILFGTYFLIMVFVGINGLREASSDQMDVNHLLSAATIAEGNFPVKAAFAPDFPVQYHYGYNLFLAAMTKITGLPIWYSYDLYDFIFIGITLLFGFLLIKDFCKNNFKAYLASLIMIFGGNLHFIYVMDGFSSLYQKYILHAPVAAPFRFLNDMIWGKTIRGGWLTSYTQSDWVILGFVLTIAVIYLYFRAVNDGKNWFKISLINGIIFSFLALSAETFFGVLGIVLLIYPFIFAILKKDWKTGKLCFKISLLTLFLGFVIASFQGGVLTQTIKQLFFGSVFLVDFPVSITPQYLLKGLILIDQNVFYPFFSSTFFLGWGWLIIFIAPVAFFVLKKYFQLGLFLILLIFIAFFLPLVVTAGAWQGPFMRSNLLTALFWNLIFGSFLGWLFLFFKKRWQEFFVIILILAVTFQGLSYAVLFSIFPALERDQPFLGQQVKKPNPTQLEAFKWIKKHTTIKDYFLTFEEKFLTPCPLSTCHNARFIIFTGRFAPSFLYGIEVQLSKYVPSIETRIPEMAWYKKVLEECPSDALKTLNYSYLYVNDNWPEGLAEKCLVNNDLKLVFQSGDNKIYKVLPR